MKQRKETNKSIFGRCFSVSLLFYELLFQIYHRQRMPQRTERHMKVTRNKSIDFSSPTKIKATKNLQQIQINFQSVKNSRMRIFFLFNFTYFLCCD